MGNASFLLDQGYEVYGTKISQEIVDIAQDRLNKLAETKNISRPIIKMERNSSLPFDDMFANGILACHVCYYCDEGETILIKIGLDID